MKRGADMASKKIAEYWKGGSWQSQGYTKEPGTAYAGKEEADAAVDAANSFARIVRDAEEEVRQQEEEAELKKDDDVEYYATPSTRVGHHDGHARTSSASYGHNSGVLSITFSHGVRSYPGISEDQWESFKSASSPGRWIDSNLPR